EYEQVIAHDPDDLVVLDDRRVADAAALEQPGTMANAHARPDRYDRLRHYFECVHSLRCTILCDNLLRDVGEQHHPVFVVLMATLHDETGCADTLHNAHGLHD